MELLTSSGEHIEVKYVGFLARVTSGDRRSWAEWAFILNKEKISSRASQNCPTVSARPFEKSVNVISSSLAVIIENFWIAHSDTPTGYGLISRDQLRMWNLFRLFIRQTEVSDIIGTVTPEMKSKIKNSLVRETLGRFEGRRKTKFRRQRQPTKSFRM